MASAKLAKMTVRINQMVMDQLKIPGWAIASIRVTMEPMSTTNMTGFLTWTRGSSLVMDPTSASLRISGSNNPRACATPCGAELGGVGVAVTVVIRKLRD